MTAAEVRLQLEALEQCLPPEWSLCYFEDGGWRVYCPHGQYYGDHKTPQQAIAAAIRHLKGL